MDKRKIISAFIEHFTREQNALMESARAAHKAATHDESVAEDRHDTFAIELSYLAHGQAERVQGLTKSIQEFEQLLALSANRFTTAVRGALVTLECDDKKTISILANHGGGASVQVDGKTITVVTPESPLGSALIGSPEGEEVSIDTKAGSKEYVVQSIS